MDGRQSDLCLVLCYFIVITVLLWDDVIMWRKLCGMSNQSKNRQTGKNKKEEEKYNSWMLVFVPCTLQDHSIVNTNTCTTSMSQVKFIKKPFKNSYVFRSTTIFRELQLSSLKSLLFKHSCMYTRCGGVAAYHVVCIGLCLWSVRVCMFLLVLWTTPRLWRL